MVERLTSLERVVEKVLGMRIRAELREGGVLLQPESGARTDLYFANLLEEKIFDLKAKRLLR